MRLGPYFWGCISVLLLAWTGSTDAAERQLAGHVPPAVNHFQAVERLPGTNRLHLAIGLPLRNQGVLTDFLQQLYDPASPQFRHYLTTEQFTERFGPTTQDYEAVINFAKTHGLEMTRTHPNRVVLDVSGTVEDIEKAFHVAMHVYQHPKEALYYQKTRLTLKMVVHAASR